MTRSITKKLKKPLDEPERKFCKLRRAVWRQQQNESLAIAGRNLFNNKASSFNNTRAKPLVPSKPYGNTLFLVLPKKDEDEERLLSIFKQIHVNLPFLEAMIHIPKGAKVLKDHLSHKERLEKAVALVKIILEMDEDELVLIILGRPFLATARAVIDVHERKLSLRVEAEEEEGPNEVQAVSFYLKPEPVEPLKWKAPNTSSMLSYKKTTVTLMI
ncbi:hypothetical protein Tco_0493322 [Tanacetum coccineum]